VDGRTRTAVIAKPIGGLATIVEPLRAEIPRELPLLPADEQFDKRELQIVMKTAAGDPKSSAAPKNCRNENREI
jgi:hypothetical protein